MTPHANQQVILDSSARFIVAACGRRFGKTEVAKRMIFNRALSGQYAWWLAPTYDMASHVWRDMVNVTRPLRPKLSLSERTIEFDGGGMLSVKSTHNPDSLRGSGLDFVVLDEAAYMDRDVWQAIVRPMLTDRLGSAAFLSTPRGRNWFYELYHAALDTGQDEWNAFNYPTSANPRIAAAELDSIQRSAPERVWREEYLAEFMEDSGAVFRRVDLAATGAVIDNGDPERDYIIGVDLAKTNDWSVLSVMDIEAQALVHIDRFQQIDYTLQLGRLEALAMRFRPQSILVERNIGEMFIEEGYRRGLPVQPFLTTNASKQMIIENLALAFERGEIVIPDDVTLKNELKAYTMERTAGGLLTFNAPAGYHDDMVISLALAWYGCSTGNMPMPYLLG